MQQFINKQQQLSLKLKLVQKARIAPGKRFIFKISYQQQLQSLRL